MHNPFTPNNLIDRYILRGLVAVAFLLILSNIFFALFSMELNTTTGLFREIIQQFDLSYEGNFATWYSVILLFLNSLSAYRQAFQYRQSNVKVARVYGILSAGFLALSIDDFISFHEYVEIVLKKQGLDPQSKSVLSINAGLVFGIVIGMVFLILVSGAFFRHSQKKNRIFMLLSVALILTSVLSEFVYNFFHGIDHVQGFNIEIAIEKSCELGAILSFLVFQQREMKAGTHSKFQTED